MSRSYRNSPRDEPAFLPASGQPAHPGARGVSACRTPAKRICSQRLLGRRQRGRAL